MLEEPTIIVRLRSFSAVTSATFVPLRLRLVRLFRSFSAVAAEVTERVCCGLEIDPKYVDVVIERWQELSGSKATLEGDGRTFDAVEKDRKKVAA